MFFDYEFSASSYKNFNIKKGSVYLRYEISAMTDIGISKEKNQDSYHVRLCETAQGQVVFAILCDGMGGLAEGEIASTTVVKVFGKWADDRLFPLSEKQVDKTNEFSAQIFEEWMQMLEECNERIQLYGIRKGIQLGTTATVMLLIGEMYYIIHVGDTRIYEITDTVSILTTDHTLVAREVELGKLSYEQSKVDSRRHILLQCVGASPELCPEFVLGKVKEGAVYLLCSDGFRHEITSEEMLFYFHETVRNKTMFHYNMKKLVELNKQRKEKDNITVVGIRT